MVYTEAAINTGMEPICNSRNFTMVYTDGTVLTPAQLICNSRNFTMVYTICLQK